MRSSRSWKAPELAMAAETGDQKRSEKQRVKRERRNKGATRDNLDNGPEEWAPLGGR